MLFPSGSIPAGPPIEPKKALLLVDFQNEFVDQQNGKLPVPNVDSFLAKLPSLISKFRSKGSVVFIRTQYQEPRSAISPELACPNILLSDSVTRASRASGAEVRRHRRGRSSASLKPADPEAFLQPGSEERRVCQPNTCGAQHCKVLASVIDPERDIDLVKSHYSAFKDTSLLTQLRTRMIQHVYVAGSISNISVYATILDAARHGIEVTLIEDCLGYRNEQCHEEAVRQMVDVLGAMGTDYQELMDDLAGLLGDVIREEDFSSRFQVSVGPPPAKGSTPEPPRQLVSPEQRKQRVEDWITDGRQSTRAKTEICAATAGSLSNIEVDRSCRGESPRLRPYSTLNPRRGTPEFSPPRKRSTQDFEDDVEDDRQTKVAAKPSLRRTASDARPENTRYKVNRARVRASRPARESSNRPVTPSSLKALGLAASSTEACASPSLASDTDTGSRTLTSPSTTRVMDGDIIEDAGVRDPPRSSPRDRCERPSQRKKKMKNSLSLVGPAEPIGEGDSFIRGNVLSASTADAAFYTLKQSVEWQKMFHRSGEVPRLVAVQGEIDEDDESEPIYRHPADESPEMLPFDNTVDMLRMACEKHVGHTLNHVLIQYYRSGEDNISEHSDKTLDVVRGSSIVNLSLGAQRIMTIRTKKETTTAAAPSGTPSSSPTPLPNAHPGPVPTTTDATERITQRIPLMHNSLFILGPLTNQYWLHSVRADKRPASERSAEELAYGGERISLTFRQIGTFVDKKRKLIWGQGARGKTKEEARRLLEGEEAEREGERMIRGFGMENQRAGSWRWEEGYAEGFDVVDWEVRGVGEGEG